MGCKCANKSEEEQEIDKKGLEDGNLEKAENDFNSNFKKSNLDLLGLDDQINPNDNEIIENNNYDDNNDEFLLNEKYANYPYKIVELINNIREDPVGYADIVEQSIQNIVLEEDKEDPSIKHLIYKKKIKVALTTGEKAFQEAIDYLRTLSPLPPLEFSQEKCIPLPNTEEELNNPSFLKSQVKVLREQTRIDVFYKDLIKIPEISGLLMIVDDTNKNAGKKRHALLSNELKYETLLKLYFGGVEDRSVTIRNIELFEENIRHDLEVLKIYKSNLEKVLDEEDHLYYYLTVTFGIDTYEAYLKWCTKSKKLLKK